ncbi:MAG: NAD-dependent epimerase/dehydratase family protein [Anaerolineales bacterium]|nr:NAD-dependent epimerase/dehydratase family protein [Anaerolineales bacterium]
MGEQTVFVTGATGFLGRHLVPQLIAAGYHLRVLVRETSDTHHLRHPQVEVVIGDVLESEAVRAAAAGCRLAVHAAGLFRFWGPAADFERVNVQGTANVVEAILRQPIRKFVHVSTIAVVGEHPADAVIDETVKCQPADAYQRSKLDAENLVRMFAKAASLPAVILRPGAFYGPWGRYAFNRLFFEDPLKGLRIQVYGGRRLTFPIYVPDVARAIVAALGAGQTGETYNICGEPLTHQSVNATVSRLAGISPARLNVSAAMMLRVAGLLTRLAERTQREPYYPLQLASYVFQDWRVSSAKAQTHLGFTPTPFEEGARATLAWYAEQHLYRLRAPRA